MMTNRVAVMHLTDSFILSQLMFESDFDSRIFISENRLPADCKIESISRDFTHVALFNIVLSSESFATVGEGEKIPSLDLPICTVERR